MNEALQRMPSSKPGRNQSPPVSSPSTEPTAAKSKAVEVQFVITGFGPFRGVTTNPTTDLVNHFAAAASRPESPAAAPEGGSTASEGGRLRHRIVKTHVFETSTGAVRDELDSIYAELQGTAGHHRDVNASTTGTEEKDERGSVVAVIVLLHLGVNYRGVRFQLEQNAYNDATFRIPDERGYQPTGELVLPDSEWGECLSTTLDLYMICRELKAREDTTAVASSCREADEGDGGVAISTDPGRFVCNYTYCRSLHQCDTLCGARVMDAEDDDDEANRPPIPLFHSLFVHVPKFEVIPFREQCTFVRNLMDIVAGQFD